MRTALWPLAILPLFAACGDGGANTDPSVTFVSPAEGDAFADGTPVTVEVQVSDAEETDVRALILTWSGSATSDGPLHPEADGTATLALTPGLGDHDVTVTATDTDGGTASATVHFHVAVDGDGDGFVPPLDCDDANIAVFPGAAEVCNGVDDDCANGIDDGIPTSNWYDDADGDGFGDPATVVSTCADLSATQVADGTDCDDASDLLNRADADGDGTDTCDGDCDDLDDLVEPGAAEVCNGIDDNCANGVDDGFATTNWYADVDHDGYGNAAALTASCQDLSSTHSLDATDCNDASSVLNHDDFDIDGVDSCAGDCNDLDGAILPGAAEVCNGADDNCAGGIDDGLPASNWYTDADRDGYGDPLSLVASCLDLSASKTLDGTDCNDADATQNFDDADLDGFTSCDGDCDDLNDGVNPDAQDICNGGIDDDCDALTVETAVVDGVSYGSLSDAVTAAPAGGIVELCEGTVLTTKSTTVSKLVTVVGSPAGTTLDGVNAPKTSSLFSLTATGELHLQSMTIANSPAGVARGAGGGGVIVADDVVFDNNVSSGNGGALSGRTITVTNSTFTGNAAALGGAIFVSAGGSLTVTDTVFDGNIAQLDGGAFHSASPVTFTRVDVIGNTAKGTASNNGGGGGVVAAAGGLNTFTDTLFSGNTAANGGGLWALGSSVDAGDTTTFDGNTAKGANVATYAGGAWVQANGSAVTWTGGTFTNNTSDAGVSFGAGGGMVLDATDLGAAQGSIVASFILLDGNETIGGAGQSTGGGIWTQNAPITITDTVTMNNTSDYGGGTSLNSTSGGTVTLERVEYRGNTGVHAGATDIFSATVVMTDCIIKENVGGVTGGIQYGALLVDSGGIYTVNTSDLGVDAEDNAPFDVLVNGGGLPTYDYGDGVSFSCDAAAGTCE